MLGRVGRLQRFEHPAQVAGALGTDALLPREARKPDVRFEPLFYIFGQSVEDVESNRQRQQQTNGVAHVIAFRTLRLAHGNHTEAAAQQIVEVLHQHVGGVVQIDVHPVLGRRTERVHQEVAERDVGAAVATDHILCVGTRARERSDAPAPEPKTDGSAH